MTSKNSHPPSPSNHSSPQLSGDDTICFTIGQYYFANEAVYECLGFRGKKERRVAFYNYGDLEYWPEKRTMHPDSFCWYGVKIENGIEVCDRRRFSANRIATKQQADEYAKKTKAREDSQRAYWAERKAMREHDAHRLAELERLAKENGWESAK